jgi:hypothetical protein
MGHEAAVIDEDESVCERTEFHLEQLNAHRHELEELLKPTVSAMTMIEVSGFTIPIERPRTVELKIKKIRRTTIVHFGVRRPFFSEMFIKRLFRVGRKTRYMLTNQFISFS